MRTSRETLSAVVDLLKVKGVDAKKSSAWFSFDISLNGKSSTINTQEVDHLAVYGNSHLESYAESVIKDLMREEKIECKYNGTIESEFA